MGLVPTQYSRYACPRSTFIWQPDTLEVLELPTPELSGPDDILVNVKAIRINPGDGLRAAGYSRVIETVK